MQFNEAITLNKNEFTEALKKAHADSNITNIYASIGPFKNIRTEDTPLDKFDISISKLFGNDPKKCLSIMFRFKALPMILDDVPRDYVREKDHKTNEIHEDLIFVACSCPLTKAGRFHKQKFLSALKQLEIPNHEKQE